MSISENIKKQMKDSSWIRKMFEEGIMLRQKFGADNVFDLSLGNPNAEPPKKLNTVLKSIINNHEKGLHKYMPNAGFSDTRQSIANTLKHETDLSFSEEDIIMTCGAAGAINVFLRSILDEDDEVIIFSPYFAEYFFYIKNQNGVPIISKSNEDFTPNLEDLSKKITKKTKAIIINSPNNPSGVIYNTEMIEQLGAVLTKSGKKYNNSIYLISDEPYRKVVYEEKCPYIFNSYENSVVVTSFSKDLGLAGERIGYIAFNPKILNKSDLIDAAIFCNRTLGFVNAPAISQRIVKELQNSLIDIDFYKSKRDFLYKELVRIGYECILPKGAFYMFPKSPIKDDEKFVSILQSKRVLVVPGIGFGTPGHFRISYCVDDSVLRGSIKGFEEAFNEI
ncbi:MAG TPA: pyridoxal phosphate-dependent aminotransferase [Dehalococcoidia bacterium]|nr:pyridoxal phosphate-dependent aminotransferase [Dehalococcoidia bacterium]